MGVPPSGTGAAGTSDGNRKVAIRDQRKIARNPSPTQVPDLGQLQLRERASHRAAQPVQAASATMTAANPYEPTIGRNRLGIIVGISTSHRGFQETQVTSQQIGRASTRKGV